MKGKNLIIFGDSYSTYAGYIPEGYGPYYSGERESEPDLESVEKTWWHMFVKQSGANLIRNDSWSGATIGYRGYNGEDYSKTSSFIYRLKKLRDEGFFDENRIDTVIVFGGTNDSWCGAQIGEEMTEGWEREDLYRVLPAIWYFFKNLRATLPNARICSICNCDINEKIVDAISKVCRVIGADVVKLKDIDKIENHPTALGMVQIKDQVFDSFCK